jgi:hypothetical protein
MRVLSIATAMIAGLLILLLGYFFPTENLRTVRTIMLDWAIILAAVAMFVGGINLLLVHIEKIRAKQKNGIYSILLIFSLILTLLFGLIPPGPNGPFLGFVLDAIIIPAETTLLALLAVTLIYASVRMLGRRIDLMAFIFLGMALFTLLAAMPMPFGKLPFLSDLLQPLLLQPFVSGGLRGILLGVSLGALTTGLRVLFGTDRPYGGK